jgi:quinol monooxygenase YgiN
MGLILMPLLAISRRSSHPKAVGTLPLPMAHSSRSRKDEPGSLQFEVLLPNDDDSKVLFYEAKGDEAAFKTTFSGASTARMRERAQVQAPGVIAILTELTFSSPLPKHAQLDI